MIYQESRGNRWAFRYEPAFYDKLQKIVSKDGYQALRGFFPKTIPTPGTEMRSRAMSWGLMQPLGNTAREHGFKEPFLTSLLDPAVNLSVGTAILKKKLDSAKSVEDALLSWNGGGNKKYPAEVLKWIDNGECLFLLAP